MNAAARRIQAALAALLVQSEAPELAFVHQWLDNWHGVGLLAVGLHRTGYDLDLRQYGDGHWRATFYVTGLAHSILGGSSWEPTVWRAVQRAGRGGMRCTTPSVIYDGARVSHLARCSARSLPSTRHGQV